jgi:hypothetical protein
LVLFEALEVHGKLQSEVHEWSIKEEFSESVESARIRADLLDAISGKGAVRYFKDTIRRYGIEKDWYAFRTEALRQIAIDWCEEHQLKWGDRRRFALRTALCRKARGQTGMVMLLSHRQRPMRMRGTTKFQGL